jgi:hypothetical protein
VIPFVGRAKLVMAMWGALARMASVGKWSVSPIMRNLRFLASVPILPAGGVEIHVAAFCVSHAAISLL